VTRHTRREFLYGSTAALATFSNRPIFTPFKKPKLPKPRHSKIDHIVVSMLENRSFDHLLGWMTEANGRQSGLVYTDRSGAAFETYPLAPDFQGCGFHDPDHSWFGGRVEYNNGACDGWLRAGTNDIYSIGYYRQEDLPFWGHAARDWTVCSRYFSALMGPTYPNKIYAHAGVTDRLENTTELCTLPTIWDRLADAGREGRYYFSDAPFLALWGTKYESILRPYSQFLADCASGDLPDVAFVDPPALGSEAGINSDDHPFGDIRAGEYWLYQTYRAVTTSPAWDRACFIANFDEWGGFFDHAQPLFVNDVHPALELRGFRVPNLIVSPQARRGYVSSEIYDHTSILKMIEWRFDLEPLSQRDAGANNIAEVLNFKENSPAPAPDYLVPPFVSQPCAVTPTLGGSR
jgi:phospholipase C